MDLQLATLNRWLQIDQFTVKVYILFTILLNIREFLCLQIPSIKLQ